MCSPVGASGGGGALPGQGASGFRPPSLPPPCRELARLARCVRIGGGGGGRLRCRRAPRAFGGRRAVGLPRRGRILSVGGGWLAVAVTCVCSALPVRVARRGPAVVAVPPDWVFAVAEVFFFDRGGAVLPLFVWPAVRSLLTASCRRSAPLPLLLSFLSFLCSSFVWLRDGRAWVSLPPPHPAAGTPDGRGSVVRTPCARPRRAFFRLQWAVSTGSPAHPTLPLWHACFPRWCVLPD